MSQNDSVFNRIEILQKMIAQNKLADFYFDCTTEPAMRKTLCKITQK